MKKARGWPQRAQSFVEHKHGMLWNLIPPGLIRQYFAYVSLVASTLPGRHSTRSPPCTSELLSVALAATGRERPALLAQALAT